MKSTERSMHTFQQPFAAAFEMLNPGNDKEFFVNLHLSLLTVRL